jgi:Prephenate dehydrogenase
MEKKIVIAGLGLIGGSIAKALRLYTDYRIYAYDINEDTLLDACSCGVIDGKASPSDIACADIIYLSLYPEDSVGFVREHAGNIKESCIVTDACGIKTEICEELEKLRKEHGFIFVGGHPMAGKEKSGFSASDPSMFLGASYIITPLEAPEDAVNTIEDLALKMGFGRVVKTNPQAHDEMIAFTSQVPHVLACAYVMSPCCENHRGFSAGSYRDVSRVADINEVLWSRLFLDNKEPLLGEIDTLIENIQKIRNAVAEEEETNLKNLLKQAGDIKRGDLK